MKPEEQIELIIKAQNGDIESRDKIILEFEALGKSIARKFRSWKYPIEDLFQESLIAIIKKIYTFDPSSGTVPSTLMTIGIISQLRRVIYGSKSRRLESLVPFSSIQDYDTSKESGLSNSINEGIENKIYIDPLEVIVQYEYINIIDETISKMKPIERDIINSHFWEGVPLVDIGKKYNTSRQRIFQIKEVALQKINKSLKKLGNPQETF